VRNLLFILVAHRNNDDNDLNKALLRLQEENARWRTKVEAAELEIRRRAPNATGLSLKGSLKIILDDRDKHFDRIEFYREELKRILSLLLEEKIDQAKKELNMFLFKNKR
jgi:hypothetical protein